MLPLFKEMKYQSIMIHNPREKSFNLKNAWLRKGYEFAYVCGAINKTLRAATSLVGMFEPNYAFLINLCKKSL